jgi:hypothetical protein
MPKQLPLREEVDRALKLVAIEITIRPFDRAVSGIFRYAEAVVYADGTNEAKNFFQVSANEAQLQPFLGDEMWSKVSRFAHALADADEEARKIPSYPVMPPAPGPVAEQPPAEPPVMPTLEPVGLGT